jgi:hypothetical protein
MPTDRLTPHTLALGGWRSILLRSLSACLPLLSDSPSTGFDQWSLGRTCSFESFRQPGIREHRVAGHDIFKISKLLTLAAGPMDLGRSLTRRHSPAAQPNPDVRSSTKWDNLPGTIVVGVTC